MEEKPSMKEHRHHQGGENVREMHLCDKPASNPVQLGAVLLDF